MTSGPKTFTGFKGVCAKLEIDGVQCWVIAKDNRALGSLLMHWGFPFEAERCKRAILIEATTLPEKAAKANSQHCCEFQSQPINDPGDHP